jgi:hypothetical protein
MSSSPLSTLVAQILHSSRVCEVALKGDNTFSMRQAKYKVSDALKSGEATALFGLNVSLDPKHLCPSHDRLSRRFR